ncbi:Annexin [Psidium guajava]|nr:Annexin [Psidium guajava]
MPSIRIGDTERESCTTKIKGLKRKQTRLCSRRDMAAPTGGLPLLRSVAKLAISFLLLLGRSNIRDLLIHRKPFLESEVLSLDAKKIPPSVFSTHT